MENIIFSLGANIVSRMVVLLINIVSFRFLLSEEYGIISLLLATTATIGAISGMGASVAVNNMVAQRGITSLSSLFVKYNYFASCLFSIILTSLIYLFFLDKINKIPSWQIFFFILFFSLFSSLNSISEAVLVGIKDFKRIFFNNLIVVLVFIPFSLYLIIEFKIWGVLFSLITYRLLLFVINFNSVLNTKILGIKSHNYNNDRHEIYESFIKLSIPVILSGLLVAPVIGLAFKLVSIQENGFSQLAYFNIVYQVYLVAIFIPNSLNGYLVSRFSSHENRNKDKKDFFKIAKNNFFFSLVVVFFLFALRKIFFLIVGNDSTDLVSNYYIMLATIVLFSLNAIFASYWPSIGRAWFGFYMNIIWAAVLIIMVFILSRHAIPFVLPLAFFTAYLILSIIQISSYKVLSNEKR